MDRNGISYQLKEESLEEDPFYSEFVRRSKLWSVDINSAEFAEKLDNEDPLRDFRKLYYYPKKKNIDGVSLQYVSDENEECIYLCGQSLGLQLKTMKSDVNSALDNWAIKGVDCHFAGDYPALYADQIMKENMAALVGAESNEIAFMNGLSVNIHIMLATFYNPTAERHKIVMLEGAFHSDLYALQSHVEMRGYNPQESIIYLKPKENKQTIDHEDIIALIRNEGKSIALVYIEGIHYYSGQLFDMKSIAEVSHEQGCVVGYDLAHAAGNVKLKLHDWNVDFGVWCTYKYLNCGPGSMGAIFCHNKHTKGVDQILPKLKGWWGLDYKRKFAFDKEFTPDHGADRFKMSNPSPLLCAMVSCSIDVFAEAGIDRIQEKQILLTGYLEYLLKKNLPISDTRKSDASYLQIITPHDPRQRGSQLSLLSSIPISACEVLLKKNGISCDIRKPSVIRLTPVPLYNSFAEVFKFVHIFKDIWRKIQMEESGK